MIKRRRGAFILPSLMTLGNLLCGFYAIILALRGEFEKACFFILLAGFFDMLDGRVARMTQTTSQFGIEFDSLADAVSFGVAPALMVYLYTQQSVGWIFVGLYVCSGILRLARFNVKTTETAQEHFMGCPIPAAAGTLTVVILFAEHYQLKFPKMIFPLILLILSYLMVSTVPFPSLKQLKFERRTPTRFLWFGLLLLLAFIKWFYVMITLIFLVYILLGPIYVYRLRKKKLERKHKQIVTDPLSEEAPHRT